MRGAHMMLIENPHAAESQWLQCPSLGKSVNSTGELCRMCRTVTYLGHVLVSDSFAYIGLPVHEYLQRILEDGFSSLDLAHGTITERILHVFDRQP